jgi:PPM family protein phosphatase
LTHTAAIALSDIGHSREINEDYVITSDKDNIYIIADGIGGLGRGEVASRLAAQKMYDLLTNTPHSDDYLNHILLSTILTNQYVYNFALRKYPNDKIGTTLTTLIFTEIKYFISHVGDSRCYLFRNKNLEQLTTDQTLKEQLQNSSNEHSETFLNSKRHILTQAVGIKETCTPIIYQGEFERDDIFLLCTDGLYTLISDIELTVVFREHRNKISKLSDHLLSFSLKKNGTDNISFILVQVKDGF